MLPAGGITVIYGHTFGTHYCSDFEEYLHLISFILSQQGGVFFLCPIPPLDIFQCEATGWNVFSLPYRLPTHPPLRIDYDVSCVRWVEGFFNAPPPPRTPSIEKRMCRHVRPGVEGFFDGPPPPRTSSVSI